MVHEVFISYASADAAVACRVVASLEAAEIPCWIAPRDVAAGTHYAEAIVDAIRGSRAFVLVFSASANGSAQVEREVDRAVACGLPILPLRIEDIVPSPSLEYYLAGRHWLDAITVSLEAPLERLTDAVRALLAAETKTEPQRPAGRRTEAASTAEGAAPAASPAPTREERRVVSALCSSIVGFTTVSRGADPEDIEAVLRAYDRLLCRIVEAHGGVVETLVGDEALAVFGLHTIHEDDPERAVRAALRIVAEADDLPGLGGDALRVCAGVHTGEALVRLDVDSGKGFLGGDIANVAARLRSSAPPMSVVVGNATHALTAKVINYEALEPVTQQGSPSPVSIWLAKGPRSRLGIETAREHLTPLIDRETELAYLTALFEKTVASSSPEVALIVGEPGIGKSRLVAELFAYVDAPPELVTWRQGRCLSYGEGITFWALGEIVKAQAGILETDDAATAEAKLGPIVPEGPDREWLRNRLRPLLGLQAPQAGRDENFTAWLRFLEGLAASGPAVLVFEDLHWADEALLAFLEFFAGNVDDVPLLVIATARPQLFEKHPAFAASIARVNRVTPGRLSGDETERLVSSLLETVRAPSQVVTTIIRRCEGNPFFAEESARLFSDRVPEETLRVLDGAAEISARKGDAEALLPGSVQAVIAARLDTLPPEYKALLADAAVVGAVFWSGALEALGERGTADVDLALRELVAKQLVHRVRTSSMAGENEFAFGHALAREVAYGQLPRLARAKKHAAVAAWVEGKAGERVEDLAEVLAHHYVTAIGLARAAGRKDLAESLIGPAVRYVSLAGDRAINLDVAVAECHYARALDLVGAESAQRPALLARWAETLSQRSLFREAANALEEAIEGLQVAGDVRATVMAMMKLARLRVTLGDSGAVDLGAEALALLDDDGPSPEKAEVLTTWNWVLEVCRVDAAAAIEAVGRAIDMSEQLELPDPVRALGMRGWARCDLGDLGGIEDYHLAFAAAKAQGLGKELGQLYQNYGVELWKTEGPRAALEVSNEGLEFVRRRGIQDYVLALSAAIIEDLGNSGEWDEALARAADLVPVMEEAEDVWDLTSIRSQQALLLARRGEAIEAKAFLAWLEEEGRESEVPFIAATSLLTASAARLGLGDAKAALGLLAECQAIPRPHGEPLWVEFVLEGVRTALAAGDPALAARLWEGIEPRFPLGRHVQAAVRALLAEARGELEAAAACFADAARRWHDFGVPYEEAQALLGQGRCLLAFDGAPEVAPLLAKAREVFARLGAKPALAETDRFMEAARAGLTDVG